MQLHGTLVVFTTIFEKHLKSIEYMLELTKHIKEKKQYLENSIEECFVEIIKISNFDCSFQDRRKCNFNV